MNSEYRRMEKAIHYIDEHAEEQPSLDDVSRYVDLSPWHFQRLFKKWTGLSPKRYLQFLTVENAKMLLHRSVSVLETAYDVGLSSTGRLHDLFVSVEAVTPGQFKSAGAGVQIRYAYVHTPFGKALLAISEKGVTDLIFVDDLDEEQVIAELKGRWPSAVIKGDRDATSEMANRIFARKPEHAGNEQIHLLLRGTNFQIRVWRALLRIPEGSVVSYSDVAKYIDRSDAVRAVAGAVGRNPVAWIIPCHRVLGSSGEIGGYRWGIARKKIMLAKELAGEGL